MAQPTALLYFVSKEKVAKYRFVNMLSIELGNSTYSEKGGSRFDIAKLIMAILILCLHSALFPKYLLPVFRLAVPLFFIISAYFLFSKINTLETYQEKKEKCIHYVRRVFLLYLFWTVVFLVPIIVQRKWYDISNPHLLYEIIRSVLFSSTFTGSWFLSSSIIATFAIFYLSYNLKVKNSFLMIIGFFFYCFCSYTLNYTGFFQESEVVTNFIRAYNLLFTPPYTSFPVAFFWILFGKLFAESSFTISSRKLYGALIVAVGGVFLEFFYINYVLVPQADGCYLSLAIVCPLLFQLLLQSGNLSRDCRDMRKMSTILFCTHGSFLFIFNTLFTSRCISFGLTLLMGIITYAIITKYENLFKILKYSY